jgi:hypothetical protein
VKLNSYWPNACFDELTYKELFFELRIFNNTIHKTVQGHVKGIITSLLTSAVTLFLLLRDWL